MLKKKPEPVENLLVECPFVKDNYFYQKRINGITLVDITCNKRVKGVCIATNKPCCYNDEIKEIPQDYNSLVWVINIAILILAIIGIVSIFKYFLP
ncbi:hypothetical protein [Helicobacter sp.]|uniref:hypothetical protein n=1 Tax=Helicobacter sp. TaxID=218 RepID=UPI0025C0FE8A|nr:hypothetical protein [Helicobacter sp.]MCI5969145.1 hypothetical protein [Helicobacter sp.]